MNNFIKFGLLAIGAFLFSTQVFATVDSRIPDYQTIQGVSGSMTSTGSDTLANLMTFWTEEFKSKYPEVQITVNSAGSSTAPPALISGSSTLAPMSREMKTKELAAFERKYGYQPTAIPIAVDALAVFVHSRNQIEGLSLQEIDAIFSSTKNCGFKSDVKQWGDLPSATGLSRSTQNKKLTLYGKNSASGTYGFFKKVALCKGDFKSRVNEQGGSAAVVQAIGKNKHAIGYSGIGYLTSRVRALPLSRRLGGEFIAPTPDNAVSGKYPLSRFLYMYVNMPPGQSLPQLEKQFLLLILSQSGQQIVEKSGYVALPYDKVTEYLNKF